MKTIALTLLHRSDTYKVHKNIVCSRVGFFSRALEFGGQVYITFGGGIN